MLGCVLATSWRHSEHTAHLIWSVDTDGHVREVANHDTIAQLESQNKLALENARGKFEHSLDAYKGKRANVAK